MRLLLTLALAVLTPARASVFDYELRGYVKNYPATWQQKPGPFDMGDGATRTWYNSTRSRLKFRWFAAQHMTLVADYEARLALTNRAGSLYGLTSASDAGLVNMAWTPLNRDHVTLVHTVDRLYAQWFSKYFVATLGRQRIAWGVSDYFSPLDKFAPFAPAEIDKEEKVGVDAALMSIPWGSLSNVEAVYSVRHIRARQDPDLGQIDAETRRRLGARFRTNAYDWDIGVMVGRFDGADAVGGSLAGYLADAGITGEVLYNRNAIVQALVLRYPASYAALRPGYVYQRGNCVQATVGASYGFAWRNLTLSGEVYYDGSGRKETLYYDWMGLALGNRISLAKHYAAGTVSFQPTPLMTVSLTALANLDEPAVLVHPQIEWSVRQNLDVRIGVQVNNGGADSEYGAFDDLLYGVIAWYF